MDSCTYTCGYRVTLEEIEDSDILELTKELERRANAAKKYLAHKLTTEVCPKRVNRLRRWVGWKLWGWAGKVNPEIMDG